MPRRKQARAKARPKKKTSANPGIILIVVVAGLCAIFSGKDSPNTSDAIRRPAYTSSVARATNSPTQKPRQTPFQAAASRLATTQDSASVPITVPSSTSAFAPSPTISAPEYQYGTTKVRSLNVRADTAKNATSLLFLEDSGFGVIIRNTVTNSSGEKWYAVTVGSINGYLSIDHVSLVTQAEYRQARQINPTSRPLSSSTSTPKSTQRSATPAPTNRPIVNQAQSSGGGGGGGGNVWIPTKGGKKYHSYSTCSGMNGPIQVTREEAVGRGFGPCGRCKP